MKRLLVYLTISTLAACGGGGGGGDDGGTVIVDNSGGGVIGGASPPNSLSIETIYAGFFDFDLVSPGVYETESPTLTMGGFAGVAAGVSCGGSIGRNVLVTNAASNESVTATNWVVCGFLGAKVGNWKVQSMALEVGSNEFTVESGGDRVSIIIIRVIDVFPPVVVREFPAAGSADHALHWDIRAKFDDYMDATTINASTVFVEDPTGALIPGSVFYDIYTKEVTFNPDANLTHFSTYTVRVLAGVLDDVGNAMVNDHIWTFTTVDDGTPPERQLAKPAADSVCVAPDTVVAARFDEPLLPASVSSSTFIVEDSAGTAVSGSITLELLTAIFTPDADLAEGETYTVRLTEDITDNGGEAMVADAWTFITMHAPEGTWAPIATPAISGRDKHTAVWTGSEMIIFGGQGNSTQAAGNHGRYDPALDVWSSVSTTDAPSSRWSHTATWTGTEMIIWGGRLSDSSWMFNSGGRYDPATDTWAPMSSQNVPLARYDHTAIWTGTELIIWGGRRVGQEYNDGARYDPATDTWTPMPTINAPEARNRHRAIWDGKRMIVWGGRTDTASSWLKDGAIYDPVTDVWSPLPAQNAPDSSKSSFVPASVVWTGTDTFVWSHWTEWLLDPWTDEFVGHEKSEARRFGANDEWQTVTDACESEAAPNAAWLDGRMLSWNRDYTDGLFYDEARDIWIPIAALAGDSVTDATVIATDDAIVVFGGDGGIMSPGRKNSGYRLTLP